MMLSVTIPPFETFYAEHNREVLGLLRRKLGRDRADDAFQETFLRALRAYDRLDHGEHLRAWVLTIASRVAIDVYRRTTRPSRCRSSPHEDARPAYEDLGELTDGLPPKERAAVVLRYGYDLTYEQIAAALDSSPDAARPGRVDRGPPAAKGEDHMSIPTDLDRRFRDAAARSGMLDAGYDLVETPLGELLVAATDRGLLRISFDPDPGRRARAASSGSPGRRVLRSSASIDNVHRELDEYFEGRRHAFDLAIDLRGLTPFSERVLHELARVPFGETATYAGLAERAGKPKAARAVGTIMNRNPVPIVLPCHRIIGANGSLVGYGGGLDRKVALLTLEGVLL